MGHVEVPSYKCCHGFMHIFLQFLLHVGIRENKETLINSTWNFSYETLSVCRSTEKQLLPNKERWAKEIHADAVQSSHSWVTNMIFPGGEERRGEESDVLADEEWRTCGVHADAGGRGWIKAYLANRRARPPRGGGETGAPSPLLGPWHTEGLRPMRVRDGEGRERGWERWRRWYIGGGDWGEPRPWLLRLWRVL